LLARINRDLNRNVSHIAGEVMACLERYPWPGNVRELENVLMQGVALCPGGTLTLDLLPAQIRAAQGPADDAAAGKPLHRWSLAEMEESHVRRVLEGTHWHRGQACAVLGVSRPRLRRMMREYAIVPPAGLDEEDEEDEGDDGPAGES
jgi:DNA-binding NtrC family response regulator